MSGSPLDENYDVIFLKKSIRRTFHKIRQIKLSVFVLIGDTTRYLKLYSVKAINILLIGLSPLMLIPDKKCKKVNRKILPVNSSI